MDIKTSSKSAYLKSVVMIALILGIIIIVNVYDRELRQPAQQTSQVAVDDGLANRGLSDAAEPNCLLKAMSDRRVVVVSEPSLSLVTASNEAQQRQGLSGVKCLGDREGMLFVFANANRQGIWMKDMLMPLDIIWLDIDKRVIHIENSVSPTTYPKVFAPESPAKYVIELASGAANRLRIKIGDKMEI